MRRSLRQRLLIIALLFCKLVAGEFLSVSMAEAAMPQHGASSVTSQVAPCPYHEHERSSEAAGSPSDSLDHSSHHSGSCKSGCKCPCAYTPASVLPTVVAQSVAPTHGVPALYAAPASAAAATALFRPPI